MSTARETPGTLLARMRLRQWQYDRLRLNRGSASNYKRLGWRQRRSSEADAAIVRCIDFERALLTLPEPLVHVLVLTYRDRETAQRTARILGISEGTVQHRRNKAIAALATALDKADLL